MAATVQVQADTVATVAWFALGAAPLLLAIVGAAVWVLAGRSLRQVERIRGQVAGINARRLDERVDVPRTRDEIHALAVTMNKLRAPLQVSALGQRVQAELGECGLGGQTREDMKHRGQDDYAAGAIDSEWLEAQTGNFGKSNRLLNQP